MIKRVERAQEARKEKKRWAAGTLAAGLLLCAMGTFYTARTRTAEVVARKRELPIYAVDRSDNKIAISFDAAWGGDKTEKILDILDEYGVKTTFFMVDIWTRRFPGLVKEIAAPWKGSGPVIFRRYDCRRDCLLPEETLPDCRILILEGSYCNLPAIREYADVRIFLDAPWETRLARLRERESEKSLQMFFDRWIPLENAYFRAYGLPDRECVVIGESG